MWRAFFILVSFVFSTSVIAQKGNTAQIEAIKKLDWMIGNWAGTSSVNLNGNDQITNIRESVQPALDGTILLINVRATDKDSNTDRQSIAYTSFSVISYDMKNNKYRWTTWRNNGKDYDEHSFGVGDNTFDYVTDDNGGKVRYKANLSNEGDFIETGEYSKNNSDWAQFITMKLIKIKRNY